MKKIITNAPFMRFSFHIATAHVYEHIQQKKLDINKAPPAQLKETAEDILKFVQFVKKVQKLAHDEFYTKWK